VATVRVEGVELQLGDAREFAERTRRYLGASPDVLHAAETLAMNLEHRIEQDGGEPLVLTERERDVAAAVLDEWLQAGAGSQAVRDLRHVIASR
jgi:hypothetical protein